MSQPFEDDPLGQFRPQALGYVGSKGAANGNGAEVNGKPVGNPAAPGPHQAPPGVTPFNSGVSGLAAIGIQPGMHGLGVLDASGHGVTVTMPGAGGHILTVSLSALLGASIGGMAAGTWKGAAIGTTGNLAVLGLVNAIFGKGFTGVGGRVAYGILGALGLAGTAWLLVRRHRGR